MRHIRSQPVVALLLVSAMASGVVLGLAISSLAGVGLYGEELSSEEREQLYESLQSDVAALERQAHVLKSVIRLVRPTVVHIETERTERSARYSGRRLIEETGSGVVMRLNGDFYILTNWHVVKGAALDKISIRLADGRVVSPQRVWSDPLTDIAVMGVSAPRLVAARLGNSSSIDIGDFVLAMGSPFGLSQSVTYGIISAKGRRQLDELSDEGVRFQDFLQTDAAINPGNSGGPLINLSGEVIGINTAIASNSGGNEGIGFSIPMNMVTAIARQLIERGVVQRAYLGVRMDDSFGPAIAAKLGLPRPLGALIDDVTPDTPADNAGMRVGDVVLGFANVPVDDYAHLKNLVGLTEVDTEVPVIVFRDRQEITLMVRVGNLTDRP